ncbi:hypothetical protein [Vibrio parahaemolyticus]|uniref:hypothetical protein n=1 Tax=Vibrio parahaemolyticus TaxID=670 RepID=UPI0023616C47|nr:hypothetical protein [Vibrio parahaemolyticus]
MSIKPLNKYDELNNLTWRELARKYDMDEMDFYELKRSEEQQRSRERGSLIGGLVLGVIVVLAFMSSPI